MGMRPSEFVAGIAQRVADRDAIDWDVSEREPSLDAAHQRLVRELRTIEKIACARVERRTTSESKPWRCRWLLAIQAASWRL